MPYTLFTGLILSQQHYSKREVSIMLFAHIFNARKDSGFKFVMYITATPALQGRPIETGYFYSKVAAKKYAAAKNAKAWNY
jgi:uncharacterized protein YbcC (UPF0753/DUF2309 family)